jgi:hypothetical protein
VVVTVVVVVMVLVGGGVGGVVVVSGAGDGVGRHYLVVMGVGGKALLVLCYQGERSRRDRPRQQ